MSEGAHGPAVIGADAGEPAVAGVDIGGTKTRMVLSRRGQVLADRTVPTADWRRAGNVADAAGLLGLVAGLAPLAPAALVVGAHGCDTAGECQAFEAALAPLTPAPVRVVNDAELMAPAAGLEGGVGVVVGTGSIAVARLDDGTMLTAGGWGWILGDEGSAPSLVREAGRAVRLAVDRGEPRDPLHDALLASLGIADVTEIGRTLNAIADAAAVGSHARAVFAAAEAGSALAGRVIREAGRFLAELVERIARRGASIAQVVAGGGVIAAQPILMTAFAEEMAHAFPLARVQLLQRPPVFGAVVLAERLSGTQRPAAAGSAP
ncbi:N-acetylglucosamine kinase [Labrys wisconsinensis]|uniref:N-acetylglucosamine kinase-like BadF-type ATPase n=1 Tax=Labrys wisconsinensis TaxID=425677 RepID=A0ABU0JJT5_9HYPH|nr:BadF/BadG/BcrA/BcrD ATPase family protein [Labrys wisconsinensis]MDQ0474543.1 N-acetylglucosamine kinase-like BadF-type ATPase [Labrys wisconsinensis]